MVSIHPSSWRLAMVTATFLAVLSTALASSESDVDITPDKSDLNHFQHYGPFGSSNGPFGSGGGSSSGGSGNGFNGRNGDGFPGLSGASLQSAIHYRTIHGILASVAIVILFPVGSILMRLVPGRLAIWVHAVFQILAYLVYIAGAAIGIYLVKTVSIPFGGGNLLSNPATNVHPIMGIVTLVTLFFQPILGYVHHARFKQLGRRTFWSHMHLWNGRIGITVGIVDGGLGLRLANASRRTKVAYIAVAVVVWSIWMLVAVITEVRRARAAKNAPLAAGAGAYNYMNARPAAGAGTGTGASGGYYAGRMPGTRGTGSRHSAAPEMTAARSVGTAGSRSESRNSGVPSRPPRSGEHSPKVRESQSSNDSASPTRR